MAESARYELRGRAAWITLNSPDTRNALSQAMTRELHEHVSTAMSDEAVGSLVITGAGKAFCAGADLKSSAHGDRSWQGDLFTDVLRMIWTGPKPVVSAVNGHAFGGGLGLVAAADVAIGAEGALFSFSEVRIGVIPAIISAVVLPKLGPHHGMRLFLTGERFDAKRAVEYGLLHRAVPADALASEVEAEIALIAEGGPRAIAEAKSLVRTIPKLGFDEALAYATEKSNALFRSDEAAEGMAAFSEKRKPRWAE